MLRSTKIVATLGPASSDPAMLERMVRCGRGRGAAEFLPRHRRRPPRRAPTLVKEIARKTGRTVGIMCDLQGPKIRVGKFKDGKVTLAKGQKFILDADLRTGRRRARRPGLQGAAARRRRGRRAAAGRRQDRARRHRRARRGGAHHGAPRRRAVEQQGHQPAGRRADRARAHRQGHRGHPHRGEDQRRLPRGVVSRSRAPTCTWRASCCAPPAARPS